MGLNFVLRGVHEQYDLVPSQFVRVPEDRSVYDDSVCIINTLSTYPKITNIVSRTLSHLIRKFVHMLNLVVRSVLLKFWIILELDTFRGFLLLCI